ncbi:MAG TPA: nucleotide disphospho-sugar-binding domain-containing protein, partial [Myxococcales bacterium]|nr:nucleotide disphospho-sugar-binding domain-containing protein [Myxococcales bacterium]
MSNAKRFLLATWDGGGNVPPAMGLARRLVEHGHPVRILADPTLADEARRCGAEHTPWASAPHRKTTRPDDQVVKDYDSPNPLAMIRDFGESFIGKPARHWAGETLAALRSWHADVLIADALLPATLIAAETLRLPSAVYCPNIWILPTPGIPPFGPGLAPANGPLGRIRDLLVRAISQRALASSARYLNAVRAEYGLPPIGTIHEQVLRADEIHVLTSPRFDFTSPAMPAHVRYAGPILDAPSWSEPWRSPWKAGDGRPLVVAGFSSTFQRQAACLLRVVEALSPLRVRGLVTLGPSLAPEDVPGSGNVVVVRSAPHSEVLGEASLLVTHCGHGTTMRGLVAGVPLLCLPMGRDQNDTAARVVHHGAGVRLSPEASATKIRRAVERVLAEPSYRRSARRLGQAIASREGCIDVVESLEQLATRPGPRKAALAVGLMLSSLAALGACTGKFIRPTAQERVEITPDRLARGSYLVNQVSSCGVCHTPRVGSNWLGGERADAFLAGGSVFDVREEGFRVAVPNITQDVETGIGGWTDDEILRAIRDGVGRDGRLQMPPMPFASWQHMSDEDALAIVAYLRSVPPVKNAVGRENEIPFLLKVGTALGLVHHQPALNVKAPARSDRKAYGAYLTKVGLCWECHSLGKKGPSEDADMLMAGSRR